MSYAKLEQRFTQLHHFAHLGAICGWDRATMMPDGGNPARSAALAELSVLMHQRLTGPEMADWFAAAAEESLSASQQISLGEMRRQWQQATVLPEALVQAKSLAGSRCEHAWREQRKQNDWQGFLGNFREVVALSREEAQIRAAATGLRPYDSLLDLYEPGMNSARLDILFGDRSEEHTSELQSPAMIPYAVFCLKKKGPFPTAKQAELGKQVMQLLGFDFNRGRQDVSVHPFCGGVPSDVRITTRYDEADFTQSLMGIIHETGHARYEQGLPLDRLALPVGQARSMGIHESQSLFFEMQMARHPAFMTRLSPLVSQTFGAQAALSSDNLARLYTRVEPGFIRVDADEVTYPTHVMLRYEVEQKLIEGALEAKDIPELWNLRMTDYLGLSTLGNDRNGCMQDIHWTDGSFGYFPSYTLGAMYAAQFAAALQRELGDFTTLLGSAEGLAQVFGWLQRHIWHPASSLGTDVLVQAATGESLNAVHFRRHLEQRYLG